MALVDSMMLPLGDRTVVLRLHKAFEQVAGWACLAWKHHDLHRVFLWLFPVAIAKQASGEAASAVTNGGKSKNITNNKFAAIPPCSGLAVALGAFLQHRLACSATRCKAS